MVCVVGPHACSVPVVGTDSMQEQMQWGGSCRSLLEVAPSKSGKGLLVTAVTPTAQSGGGSRQLSH